MHRRSCHVFIDGQNLFLSQKAAYGYRFPNFDVVKMAQGIADKKGWEVSGINFYTGMPGRIEQPTWHDFWSHKLDAMRADGVQVFAPALRYLVEPPTVGPDGFERPGQRKISEKGVDVRIALDMARQAHLGQCEAMILVSRDQDLREAVFEVQDIAAEANRKIEVGCAFPVSDHRANRAVDGTKAIPLDREFFEKHLDAREYRCPVLIRMHEVADARELALRQHQGQNRPRQERDSVDLADRALRLVGGHATTAPAQHRLAAR